MTYVNQSDIASQIIANLAVVEPDLDTSIGSTIRKMIDALAEQIAEAYADNNISSYQYSIDTLSAGALDDFTANFGFTRFVARSSTGIVTFARPAAQTSTPVQAVYIPPGTTVGTTDTPAITFVTLIGSTLVSSAASIDIPIIGITTGQASNVPATSIINIITPLSNIASITNAAATSGGSDAESDSAYRTRFKATIFRGFLGTTASFNGTALENPNVQRAVTIGSSLTHTEQIQIIGGVASSIITDAEYVLPYNQFLQSNTGFLTPQIDFSIGSALIVPNPTVPLALGVLGSGTSGTTYQFSYYWLTPGGSSAPSPTSTVAVLGSAGVVVQWPTPPLGVIGIAIMGYTPGAISPQIAFSLNSVPNPYTTGTFLGSAATPSSATLIASQVIAGQNTVLQYGVATTNPSYTSATVPAANTAGETVIVNSLSMVTCPDGIYELQFDYLPFESRNSVTQGITNRVDVYTDGSDIQATTQILAFYNNGYTSNTTAFNINPTSPYYFLNFQRLDGTYAHIGNLLVPLANVPLVSLPVTITAPYGNTGANQIYALGTDYWQVANVSETGNSNHSLDGLEWLVTNLYGADTTYLTGTMSIAYAFNALPQELEISIKGWSFTSQDIWVHQAVPLYLNFYLVVILNTGQTSSSITTTAGLAINALISSAVLGSVVETSSLIAAVMNVPGIQAARFATKVDNPVNYAIQQVTTLGNLIKTFSDSSGRVIDIILPTTSYPVFNSVNLIVRSQNSFRNGS
jgi:uncharacterized phage protein gp47/JayE